MFHEFGSGSEELVPHFSRFKLPNLFGQWNCLKGDFDP
jgi:hypothetical protein